VKESRDNNRDKTEENSVKESREKLKELPKDETLKKNTKEISVKDDSDSNHIEID